MSLAQVIAQQVAVKHLIEAAQKKKVWVCDCSACVVVRTDPDQCKAVLSIAKNKGYVPKAERQP